MSETESDVRDGTEVERGNYRYATVVKQTMDDPRNDIEAGRVEIVAGQFEDGVIRTVFHDGDFLEIEGKQLEQFHADTRMSASDIRTWAVGKAKKSEVNYSEQ